MTSTELTTDRLLGTWTFAGVHSSASFSLDYLVAQFRGTFEELDASLVNDKLSGSVSVASLKVKDENLAAHLQSPDFFDAEHFPQITFVTETITFIGDDVDLTGALTMKGTTKPLEAKGTIHGPTEDFMGNTRLGFSFETVIDRSAFGVSWNADLPSGGKALSDEVRLVVELEFHRA